MSGGLLLGICGRMRAGKDTIAGMLSERGFDIFAFADKVREAALAIDPIILAETNMRPFRLSELINMYGWELAKVEYPGVRQIMQRVGTDAGRNVIGENCWIDALRPIMWSAAEVNPLQAIKDVRHPNECAWIHDEGGYIIRVTRPGLEQDSHESESYIDDLPADVDLINDGTLDDLQDKVAALFNCEWAV